MRSRRSACCAREPRRLEVRELEEEIAKGAAAKLTAAAYDEEPWEGALLDGDSLARAARDAEQEEQRKRREQLLVRVPLGGLCWATTLGIAGCKQRFKSRLMAIRSSGPLVRFLADEAGRSAALFLPTPAQQFVQPNAIELWVEPDTTAECAGGTRGAVIPIREPLYGRAAVVTRTLRERGSGTWSAQ